MKKIFTIASVILFTTGLFAQEVYNKAKFQQIEDLWPTPNNYRTGSGAPGNEYWQQKADYVINVKLNDDNQSVTGSETITYTNNSPDVLTYVWVQLDQNIFDKNSITNLSETKDKLENMTFEAFDYFSKNKFDGGYKIASIKDAKGGALGYVINNTMMRVDLPAPLKSKQTYSFSIDWSNNINNAKTHGGRGGYELFEKDNNVIYEMAQWYPRMCVYDDVNGWQNKQYLGGGEFALEFGDYKVSITVPADHIVAATGVLQNPSAVLTSQQSERLDKARKSDKPVVIVTQAEATEAEKAHSKDSKTWVFKAENVRDFAWASSRKFIWDAMNVKLGDKDILAMSFYPKEGNPLWEKYSTHAVAHTLKVYSRFTVNYQYPVAISVNGPIGGMEYPMICFNGPRPEADGTYSDATKYGLISVVIHEVGHNFFPMILNSDERRWAWMDEGFNSFCEYLAEKEWEPNYPTRRGEPQSMVKYMGGDKANLDPIMTNPEIVIQLGNNTYGKTAAGLNILRETIMGRDLFDYSFKEYARRWAYKHPKPADFFRTMKDASGVDLDWFWKQWFYGTEPCDIALNNVTWYTVDSQNPEIEKLAQKAKKEKQSLTLAKQRDKSYITKMRVDEYPELVDFYTSYSSLDVTNYDKEKYQKYYNDLDSKQKSALEKGLNYYVLDFDNVGGLTMPIIIEMEYENGSKEIMRIPAEIWRRNSKKVSKLIITEKPIKQFTIDPYQETADIDTKNNTFPRRIMDAKFQLNKSVKQNNVPNALQLQKDGKL
jgi:hypothetical protein